MGMEDDLLALIDLIYEASFDSTLWPMALISLADFTGTPQVSLAAMDRRAEAADGVRQLASASAVSFLPRFTYGLTN